MRLFSICATAAAVDFLNSPVLQLRKTFSRCGASAGPNSRSASPPPYAGATSMYVHPISMAFSTAALHSFARSSGDAFSPPTYFVNPKPPSPTTGKSYPRRSLHGWSPHQARGRVSEDDVRVTYEQSAAGRLTSARSGSCPAVQHPPRPERGGYTKRQDDGPSTLACQCFGASCSKRRRTDQWRRST